MLCVCIATEVDVGFALTANRGIVPDAAPDCPKASEMDSGLVNGTTKVITETSAFMGPP